MPTANDNGPGAQFNPAQYLVGPNAGHSRKTATGKIQRFRLRGRERIGDRG
jgi:hypothetical protein